MNLKNLKYLIPLVLICFTFGSCKKSKESKIIGTWEKINVITQAPLFVEYWKFESDGTVRRYEYYSGDSIPEIDKGTWEIVQKIDKAFVNMEFETLASQQEDYNNAWRIHKLKKKMMILIFIDNGQKTIEFKPSSLF